MPHKIRLSPIVFLTLLFSINLSACVSAVPTSAQDKIAELSHSLQQLQARYPADKLQSEAIANRAITDSSTLKQQVEAWYTQTQAACYADFFVNNCLYQAKLIRRDHLIALQIITVNANAFLRQQHSRMLDSDDKPQE